MAATRTLEQARSRVLSKPAVDLVDLALLTGTSISTINRAARAGELPVPSTRIGQRWVIPSAPVRELLHMADAPEKVSA